VAQASSQDYSLVAALDAAGGISSLKRWHVPLGFRAAVNAAAAREVEQMRVDVLLKLSQALKEPLTELVATFPL